LFSKRELFLNEFWGIKLVDTKLGCSEYPGAKLCPDALLVKRQQHL